MLNNEKKIEFEYNKCYIAFLDLLGFKNVIGKKTCQEILDIFSNIKIPIQSINIYKGGKWVPLVDQETINKVNMKIMSDSICFYITASETNAFCTLAAVCTMFQIMMLKLPDPVLMRGGIVYGELFAFGDITYGPGLTNAYLLEEKSAKYPRIIMTGDIVERAFKETTPNCQQILSKLLNRDFDAFYMLNYFGLLPADGDNKQSTQIFYEHIEKVLNSAIDPSIREKYLYLESNMQKVIGQGEQTNE